MLLWCVSVYFFGDWMLFSVKRFDFLNDHLRGFSCCVRWNGLASCVGALRWPVFIWESCASWKVDYLRMVGVFVANGDPLWRV